MSLQGPLVVVAEKRAAGLVQACADAGAFPIIEARWADASAAVARIRPAAVVIAEPEAPDSNVAHALAQQIAAAQPIIPVVARVHDDSGLAVAGALPVPADAPAEQLIARLSSALRLRALHITVLRRAQTLKTERNILAELPQDDPIEDATVLVIGRGRSHPELTVAVGERMGVMGALSVDAAARGLNAREIEGIAIGDGLPVRMLDAFLTVLTEDPRYRDLPIGALGSGLVRDDLPNFVRAADPQTLIERMLPLVRLRAFEGRLKRLSHSIERKGMLDVHTGLLNINAFGHDLTRAIDEAGERGSGLSIARFSFEEQTDRRSSLDAARLISRLVRNVDFACRQDDGSILAVFTDTDLRHAHVVARRLASVLKHTMLRPGVGLTPISPNVTLASMKPSDTVLTLMARVAPHPVADEVMAS